MESFVVEGKTYRVVRLLGHGKGGYSYLAKRRGHSYVIKAIHHEPCAYYRFGDKIQAEEDCYLYLKKLHIRVPFCYAIDHEQELVLKQYIAGPTVADLLRKKKDVSIYLRQVTKMAEKANKGGVNIDYYPPNFVVHKGLLYYVDYETSKFDKRYTFDVWGKGYWTGKKSLEK
jgi:TP53 regulating kinase-like protein